MGRTPQEGYVVDPSLQIAIRDYIKKNKMTIAAFGKKIGFSDTHVSKCMSGQSLFLKRTWTVFAQGCEYKGAMPPVTSRTELSLSKIQITVSIDTAARFDDLRLRLKLEQDGLVGLLLATYAMVEKMTAVEKKG